ncbi:beta-1,4-N-acetylgalactosaminyltransferase bre-4-like isoform X2 [Haliotis asinina]|uniref:beta-1,4-N-acetylgalactosaminyltransferase bre-4-like isoform X2 n=1 Tax=Haliotis asinina TaxID=109174 RepID=UPI0035327DDD
MKMDNDQGINHQKPQHTKIRRLVPYAVSHEGILWEDDNRLLTIVSLYVLGLIGVFIFIFLLCHFLKDSGLSQLGQSDYIDIGNVALYNEVYTNRIIDIIRTSEREYQSTKTSPVSTRRKHGQLCDTSEIKGPLNVNASHSHDGIKLVDVIEENVDIQYGGKWKPSSCYARYRVAIIIPYRDRLHHLVVLLAHLLPILRRQQLDFRVFVVEQFGNATFNKGRIMNAAFKEALKIFDFQCVVFHDVDLIPEDDRNMYSCPWQPRHMSVAIDEMNYRLKYDILVGGVLNLRVEHYQELNGYSNMYWGWGAEDDDMAYRILHVGFKITRPPSTIARYKMIKHQKRRPTSWHTRSKLLHTAVKRYKMDGLNSVSYTLMFVHDERLFTHIMVDVGKP